MGHKLFDLSAEITGVSGIITGLSNQLGNKVAGILTPGAMKDALFGAARYLERMADGLGKMSRDAEEKGGVA